MSLENFEKAMELAKNIDYYDIHGEMADEFIEKAEQAFDFKLSKQHYLFYKEYGYLDYDGCVFYGIYPGAFEGPPFSSAVLNTIYLRNECGILKQWIPLYDYDEEIAYFDYEHLNAKGEPRIIAVPVGRNYDDKDDYYVDVLAEDLGDYLLQMVTESLEDQNKESV
ncbi:MAG: SMI1/KNR4 family protein [Oscillospiraceae bacterium]